MGLISKFKNFVVGAISSYVSQVNYTWVNNTIHGQLSNTQQYIKKAYQLNADIYSIVSFIASKVAMVPFVLYEIKDEKALAKYKTLINGDMRTKRLEKQLRSKALSEYEGQHRILNMLNKSPNSNMTASEIKFGYVVNRLITGNSFLRGFAPELEPDKFVEIYLLPSQWTIPIGGGQYTAVRAYKMTWNAEEIPAFNISHSKYFNPDFEYPGNPYIIGQSPVQAAANVILQSNSGTEAATKAFQNGGMAGILYQDGGSDLNDAQRDLLQEHIDQKVSGSKNYKQILAASSKLGWLKIGESPVDLGILELLNANLRTLCNIFHVNSALFNDPENKSYNNISEARKAAITDAVLPELTALRDALNLWLIPGWEKADNKKYFIDYDASIFPEIQANMQETAAWLNTAWWLTPNEKREQMDYDLQTEEFDQIFVPMGMAPLGSGSSEDDMDFQKAFKVVKDIDYKD